MDIRIAQERDIPGIVALLKQSLGESLLPKSETYWRWKHVENPFGVSPVLVTFDGDTIVGVRAFMPWTWQRADGQVLRAIRAVDTATHPDYQGKGIFKKLTLSLLEYCQEHGMDVVFNTPNQNSKPGYLKMGWREAGKLPIHIELLRPVSMVMGKLSGRRRTAELVQDDTATGSALKHPGLTATLGRTGASVAYWLEHPDVPALLASSFQQSGQAWHTPHTRTSLAWRYDQVPVVKYAAHGLEQGGKLQALMFYRLKASGLGIEFRVADLFVQAGVSRRALAAWIRKEARRQHADYISVSGYNPWYKGSGLLNFRNLRIGPGVTIRAVASEEKLTDLAAFRAWSPSLGDLELF
jgi:N-acetylglutamate synthase-like GNAT family acetyltransferase